MTTPRPETRAEQAAALRAVAAAPIDREKLRRDLAEARVTAPAKIAAVCAQLGITPNRARRVA